MHIVGFEFHPIVPRSQIESSWVVSFIISMQESAAYCEQSLLSLGIVIFINRKSKMMGVEDWEKQL